MTWQEILITVVSAIVTALASWLATRVTSLINSKIKDGKLKGYLNAAMNVVTNVVKSVYQTYVESIKGTDAWTAEAQKNALAKALESAREQLSGDVKDYIQKEFGDIDKWIITQIEAAIYNLKNKPAEVVNASA